MQSSRLVSILLMLLRHYNTALSLVGDLLSYLQNLKGRHKDSFASFFLVQHRYELFFISFKGTVSGGFSILGFSNNHLPGTHENLKTPYRF